MGQGDGQNSGYSRHSMADSGDMQQGQPAFEGYDVTDVPLGDLMRGERATYGKSLLDVERELKIRAAYIAAIENGDVAAFSSPGFIAGYVRSYARYLGIDPEYAFARFCAETGFQGVHGSSGQQAQSAKRSFSEAPKRMDPNDVMSNARISFEPRKESFLSGVEPGALGSAAVLVALVLGLGYGAWAVLHDIQRLQIAPVDEAPVPLAQLDPLAGANEGAFEVTQGFDIAVPAPESLERLYRPQALEAPVLTPRDGALSTLNPDEVGTLAGQGSTGGTAEIASANAAAEADTPPVQVTQARVNEELMIFAVRPTWVRVSSASGAVLFEGTLNAGESYAIPETAEAPTLMSGNAGSLYFAVGGVTMGPSGQGASIARDVELTAEAITSNYSAADPASDPDLSDVAALVLGGTATE